MFRVDFDNSAVTSNLAVIAIKELEEGAFGHLVLGINNHIVKLPAIHSTMVDCHGIGPVNICTHIKSIALA